MSQLWFAWFVIPRIASKRQRNRSPGGHKRCKWIWRDNGQEGSNEGCCFQNVLRGPEWLWGSFLKLFRRFQSSTRRPVWYSKASGWGELTEWDRLVSKRTTREPTLCLPWDNCNTWACLACNIPGTVQRCEVCRRISCSSEFSKTLWKRRSPWPVSCSLWRGRTLWFLSSEAIRTRTSAGWRFLENRSNPFCSSIRRWRPSGRPSSSESHVCAWSPARVGTSGYLESSCLLCRWKLILPGCRSASLCKETRLWPNQPWWTERAADRRRRWCTSRSSAASTERTEECF